MIKLKQLFFYVFSFFVTYLIYVYPYDILNYFIFKEEIFSISSFYLNLFFYSIVIYYLRSHSTFLLFRILVYEGMGIGFISFWIVNLALLTDYVFLQSITKHEANKKPFQSVGFSIFQEIFL